MMRETRSGPAPTSTDPIVVAMWDELHRQAEAADAKMIPSQFGAYPTGWHTVEGGVGTGINLVDLAKAVREAPTVAETVTVSPADPLREEMAALIRELAEFADKPQSPFAYPLGSHQRIRAIVAQL